MKRAYLTSLRRASAAALLASTALATSGTAFAQDTAPEAAADDNVIIVTATKRSESLQNVPISLQVLSPAVMEQQQVTSFDDYAKLLPSVSYQSFGPSQSQLYFRGIASGGDGLASGPLPTSGLYIDEIPVTTIYQSLDIHVYDMARIEALAGPQGTLYGASSLSGTLRLITNKPDTSKFEAGYDLQLNKFGEGNFGGEAEGFVNLPLSDTMALRVMGFYDRDGGYIDNTFGERTYLRPHTVGADVVDAPMTVNNSGFVEKNFNDVESYGGRAALGIDLDDNWTATPAIIYQHQVANGAFLFDPKVGDLEVHDFTPDKNKDRWYLASLTIKGTLSNWDVTYSGSYLDRKVDTVADYSYFSVYYDAVPDYNYALDALGNDLDPTQIIRSRDTYTKMAHELRVSSPSEDRFRITAGMYLQRQTNRHIAHYIFPGISTASTPPFSPPVPGGFPDDVFYTNIYRVDRDYAMFGEASFDILPNLTLTGGIRGFMAKNTLDGFSGGIGSIAASCPAQNANECPNIDKRYTDSGETHKANLTWKIDRDHMVYATYSTGFRPGGNNRAVITSIGTLNPPPYRADTLTNYEIGWKTSWLGRSLRFNGAFFLEDWNDVQYSLPGLLGIFSTYNAGKARSKGVEADINWTIGGLNLAASGTYVDAKLTSPFCDVVNGCDPANGGSLFAPKGQRLPITPKFKINGTARYTFDLGSAKSFVQAGASHQGGTTSYLTTDGAAAFGPTKGFTTVDFSAGTEIWGMTFEAFIQNAFDKRGVLSKNSYCAPALCSDFLRLYTTKPQFFGIKVGQRF
jgi:outer membrane receptor protein involved in Fe transport